MCLLRDSYFLAIYDNTRLGEFKFSTEVRRIIRHLEDKGLAIVIITNGHHKIQRAKLDACQAHLYIPDPARILVGGEEVLNGRAEKPSASIFLQACIAVGCAPREAIHVGDNLKTDVLVSVHSLCSLNFFIHRLLPKRL